VGAFPRTAITTSRSLVPFTAIGGDIYAAVALYLPLPCLGRAFNMMGAAEAMSLMIRMDAFIDV
jgi:hypothetical protein